MDHFDMSPIEDLTAEPIPTPEFPTPASIATSVVSGIAATAASSVIIKLIYDNTETDDYRLRDHAKLYIGSYVIGMLVADTARKHVARKVKPTMKSIESWLWVPVDEEKPSTEAPETTPLETLIQAIPDKQ